MSNIKEEEISDKNALAIKLRYHTISASFIVVFGVLFVFFSEGTYKELGTYVIIFGITYSFITRFRTWKNNN